MSDQLTRTLSQEAGILVLVASTTTLAQEGARRHQTSPLATMMLGRGLTIGALMGGLLKNRQRLALKLGANGPVSKLIVDSDSDGRVRGYISPTVIDLASDGPAPGSLGIFGNVGMLTVNKDLLQRDPSEGSVILVDSDIDANFDSYFQQSEQIPSRVRTYLGLDAHERVTYAGGILVQAMPGHDPRALQDVFARLDDAMAQRNWPTEQVPSAAQLLKALYGPLAFTVLETNEPAFRCSCSVERSRQALRMLGKDELTALIEEGNAVVECHFCHEAYYFDRADLEELRATFDA